MKSALYLISLFLVVGWIVGFFIFGAGWLIHLLLLMAIVALLLGILKTGLMEK